MGPATGVSTLWGQDAPGTCRGNQSLILAVPALGICPSDAPPGTGSRDKATCTQVSPQTSTMTSSLACLKGMGMGMGASLSQNTFGALGILCLRQAPSVPGAGLGLVTQMVPWMLRTSPPEPQASVWRRGQGGSRSRGECEGARCPGLSLGEEGRASPSFILAHVPTRGHPCPEAASSTVQAGLQHLGPQTSAQRGPVPLAAEALLSVPRASVPGPWGPSQVGGWRGSPKLCLLASLGSGDADPRGGKGFPWCSVSRPVWPGLACPP